MIFYNTHAIVEQIKANPDLKGIVYFNPNGTHHAVVELAKKHHIPIEYLNSKEWKEHKLEKHKTIALLTHNTSLPSVDSLKSFLKNAPPRCSILLLDKIQDPRNLGAILRNCEQFSCDLVIVPGAHAVKTTTTVASSSAGALYKVPVLWGANLYNCIDQLKEYSFWIWGAHMDGENLGTQTIPDRVALILGNEGSGISPLLKKSSDTLVRIETSGQLDSLNVSVASGIFLYRFNLSHKTTRS